MGLNPLDRRRDLLERLRKNGNRGVDGDTAFEAAAEIERCLAAFEDLQNQARQVNALKERGERAIDQLHLGIAERDAEIERLKADNTAVVAAVARGFRQGYHAAASRFSQIVFELVTMTVPIGQQHQHTEHHHHGQQAPPDRGQAAYAPSAGTARAETAGGQPVTGSERIRRRPGAGHAAGPAAG
jgi:hypothetical protein